MSAIRKLFSDPAFLEIIKRNSGASAGPAPGGGLGGPASSEPDEALDATSTDMFFDKNLAKLTASDKESLDAYASAYLAGKSSAPVNVDGFASIEGEPAFNQKLSQQRADTVADYLRKKGLTKVAAKGRGSSGAINELRQNRRASIMPPRLTVRDLVGPVVIEPPISGQHADPTLGAKAPEPDISNIHIPDPPPVDDDGPAPKYPTLDDDPKPAEPAEAGKHKPPSADDSPVETSVNAEGKLYGGSSSDPKVSADVELKYTVQIRDSENAWVMKGIDLTVSIGKDGKIGPVTEAQLNVIQKDWEYLKLDGKSYKAELTLSLNGEAELSGGQLESIKTSIQAELEIEVTKRTSLKFDVKPVEKTVYKDPATPDEQSKHPEVVIGVSKKLGGGDDKQEERDKMKKARKEGSEDHGTASQALEEERKEIKEKYEQARDKVVSNVPEKARKIARFEMDEAIKVVNKPEPFAASDALKAAGVTPDVEAEMKNAVETYQKEMFHSMGGDD